MFYIAKEVNKVIKQKYGHDIHKSQTLYLKSINTFKEMTMSTIRTDSLSFDTKEDATATLALLSPTANFFITEK